jgi:lipid-A-disaccharide synthase
MKYYLISGEASGDLHGSNLIKALMQKDEDAEFRCWGGDLMAEAGATVVKHYRDLAFMGFTEVIKNLPTILKNISFCKVDIEAYQPDVLILIDYPGFNLRIAKWAKEKGIRIVYYISPQIWAWKENRVHLIRKCVDLMLVILPFEKAFYKKWNMDVAYVGHPLVEVIDRYKTTFLENEDWKGKRIVALLPGSRKQEIKMKLPIMLSVCSKFPNFQFVLAKAPGIDASFYEPFLIGHENVSVVEKQTYHLLMHSEAALVTSGTATLETALFGVPEVICYKGSSISYHIAKRLIKVKYIGLVNLIMDRLVVRELIQEELTTERLQEALNNIVKGGSERAKIEDDYEELQRLLRAGGKASEQAAALITDYLQPSLKKQAI